MRVSNTLVLVCLAALALVGWLLYDGAGAAVRAAGPHSISLDEDVSSTAAGLDAVESSSTPTMDGRVDEGAPPAPTATTEPELPAGRARLVGRVLTRAGEPIAGARVLASASDGWMQIPLDAEADLLERHDIKVYETTTNAAGTYTFAELEAGMTRLVVRAAGYAPHYAPAAPTFGGKESTWPTIALDPGVSLRGRVVDAHGQPVAGATVAIAYDCIRRRSKLLLPGRGAPVTQTNADGEFVVDQLAVGAWHIYVDDGLHLVGEARGELLQAGLEDARVRVVLDDAWSISGTVKPVEGDLPVGLRVSLRATESREESQEQTEEAPELASSLRPTRPAGLGLVRHGLVGADGSFVVVGLLPNRSYRLALARPKSEGKGWRALGIEDLKPVPSGTKNTLVRIRPMAALTFTVVDAATGLPLEDLLVWGGQGRERNMRDDKGQAKKHFQGGVVEWSELRHNPTGKPFQLRIAATGYLDHEVRSVNLKAGTLTNLGEVRLQPTTVAKVHVYREGTREPVVGARVVLADKSQDELTQLSEQDLNADWTWDPKLKSAVTDDAGVARLTAPAGKTTALQASAKGCVPGPVVRQLMPDSGECVLELFVKPGGVVELRVQDGNGTPVVKQEIQHMLPLKPGTDEEQWGESVHSDDAGLARVDGLSPGTHKFRLAPERGNVWTWGREGQSQPEEPWSEVRVEAGQTASLTLRGKQRGSLSGLVREEGRPLEDAGVRLVPHDPNMTQGWAGWGGENDPLLATSDETGLYAFESLPVGTYRLFVTHKTRRHAKEYLVEVLGRGVIQNIDLLVARIEGRVLDEDGVPLVGVEVNLWPQGERIEVEPPYDLVYSEDESGSSDVDWKASPAATTRTDATGMYAMRGVLTEVPLIVQVQGPWTEEVQTPAFTLLDGEVRHGLDVRLRKAGRLQCSSAVTFDDSHWMHVEMARTDANGARLAREFTLSRWNTSEQLRGLLPGEWKVKTTIMGPQGPAAQPRESTLVIEVGRTLTTRLE